MTLIVLLLLAAAIGWLGLLIVGVVLSDPERHHGWVRGAGVVLTAACLVVFWVAMWLIVTGGENP